MYRSDNDRSIKAQEYSMHNFYCKDVVIRLQYGMYILLVEVSVRPIIYNAL